MDTESAIDASAPALARLARAYEGWGTDHAEWTRLFNESASNVLIRNAANATKRSEEAYYDLMAPANQALNAAKRAGERIEAWLTNRPEDVEQMVPLEAVTDSLLSSIRCVQRPVDERYLNYHGYYEVVAMLERVKAMCTQREGFGQRGWQVWGPKNRRHVRGRKIPDRHRQVRGQSRGRPRLLPLRAHPRRPKRCQ